jgi:amino acid adenylation domain-containing protein/FkbH-like protein
MNDSSFDALPRYAELSLEPARADTGSATQTVVVAATFTANLLERPLGYWLCALEISAEIVLAPYLQVLQELLDPNSVSARNRGGFNVFLIRPEDWIRDRLDRPEEQNRTHLRAVSEELIAGLEVLRSRTSAATLIFLCPTSPRLQAGYGDTLEQVHEQLRTRLAGLPHTHCWTAADLQRLYPVAQYEDPSSDRLAHIPYTPEYFVAVATLLARRMAVLQKPPFKVIAVDCDNTLWKGVCGEDGAAGVELTPTHLELQRLLVRQHDAGILLCLCSKNSWDDVEAVFKQRPEMPLRLDHVVSSRVNWNAKSENLRSLAAELDLALDSFVFVDDSALECAEVRSACPAVLTMQLPQAAEDVRHFIDHVWAFDRIAVTSEAKQRKLQYRQNRERTQALEGASDMGSFLRALELQVEIAPMASEHLARVAELVQRTNQFNLTGVRRRAAEIEAAVARDELQALVVHVRDRFGDYGLVGAVLFDAAVDSLQVDTFVLSCRALGRAVEHRVVNELGRIARQRGLANVTLRFRPTARNIPARAFLELSFAEFRTHDIESGVAGEVTFEVPVEFVVNVEFVGTPGEHAESERRESSAPQVSVGSANSNWHEVAYRLSRLEDIVREIQGPAYEGGVALDQDVSSHEATAAKVAEIWCQVLGRPQVDVGADFFELGGDSILAVQVITKIGAALGREVSIYEFFEGPTVAEIASRIADAGDITPAIESRGEIGPAPLSSAQRRMWFIDRFEHGSVAYHVSLSLRLHGELDVPALQWALDTIVQRHEVLRSVFVEIDGEPRQQVIAAEPFPLAAADLVALNASDRKAEFDRQIRQLSLASFDLSQGPLIRGKLLKLAASEHVLAITTHHIVSDGWSLGVLIRELSALYVAALEGRPDPLPPLSIQYADYALRQQDDLQTRQWDDQLRYWQDHLRDAPDRLNLPTDRVRPMSQSYRGGSIPVTVDASLTQALKALARRTNTTLAMVLHAAWSLVLSRLSAQDEVVVGIPVANRLRAELEPLIGFFVNTIAVRVQPQPDATVAAFLETVRQAMVGAYAHQDVPFERVVETVQPARSLNRTPVFQAMFVLQNAPRDAIRLPRLSVVEEEVPEHTSQFDLTLELQEVGNVVTGRLVYAADLFEHATARRWAGYFEEVLAGFANDPDAIIGQLALLDRQPSLQLLESFNATGAAYPRDALLHELFEQQVELRPDAPAALWQDETLSYAELNRRANRLARQLLVSGVQPGDYVPVLMVRSLALLIAQLAVLKCGGVYVPLDPELPEQRRNFIIRDCKARLILADRAVDGAEENVTWLNYAVSLEQIAKQSDANLQLPLPPRAPAYVMYTSGSTGVSKGVVVPHHAVSRLVLNNGYADIVADDCFAHHSNPSFDASTFEVWAPLLHGARMVVVPPSTVLETQQFGDMLLHHRVTMLYMSVGLFNEYADALADVFSRVRFLMVGGDALDPRAILKVLTDSPPGNLLNVYGPTECATYSTTHPIEAVEQGATSIPIGKPMSNTRTYLLDRWHQPVPIGVPGELYIGGEAVADGYLNRPELTAERFLPDPFNTAPSARMYRSGDLGRWRADGSIEYLGRNDEQVKIRGFRVELGEIGAQLTRHPLVKEAIVLARSQEGGDKQLVAYVVAADPYRAPQPEELRSFLEPLLPHYMVPSAFVGIELLPLNANGKLDRKALPAPELTAFAQRAYQAPSGDIEQAVAEIWQEILRVPRIGRHDRFFEIGGHSLAAMQAIARIQARFSVDISVRALFEAPTIAQLAQRVEECVLESVSAMSEEKVMELLNELSMEEGL